MEEITNKDLHHLITDVKDKVIAMETKALPEINERAKVTNGSVAEITKWKERITGAIWAFGITFTVVIIPLFTWAFITISKLPTNIDKAVDTAISSRVESINYEK